MCWIRILCFEKMGVEFVKSGGFEVAPAPFEGKPETNGKVVDKVAIKKAEESPNNNNNNNNNVLISDVPKDAAEEWPAAKQIRSFYFVKYRHFDDPKIKAKLDVADKELEKLSKARSAVYEQLKAKRVKSSFFCCLETLMNGL